ncbi:MAG: SAM-dependent methyltransferase [Sphingobacteriia bacterium]|jgi:SAM-dependent methyltransferase|nr:MAG: SAM-dependent methyltransferase [Sphingobacteriia bacterium]
MSKISQTAGLWQQISDSILLLVPKRKRRVKNFSYIKSLFVGKKGIEIGGPSRLFTRNIPIYDIVEGLDGTNFSNKTVWEGEIELGQSFQFGNRSGQQFILDATNLKDIKDDEYEFVISSHCLEHIANPLKALQEWLRVIKPGGIILIVVPNKAYCFDHRRSYTSFQHILSDYESHTSEKDLTHLDEILKLHDLSMDLGSANLDFFKDRSINNFENRCLHHHVYNLETLKKMLHFFGVETLYTDITGLNMTIIGKTE